VHIAKVAVTVSL